MDQLKLLPNFTIIKSFFAILGVLFYIALIFLFNYYYRCLSFIKEKIFTFIFINSLSSLISAYIHEPTKQFIFVYTSNTIQFYLILFFIDKCLSSNNLSKDKKDLEINFKIYIILLFMLVHLPISKYLTVSKRNLFDLNAIKLILCLLFYEHIREKIQMLIYYFKDKASYNSEFDLSYNSYYYKFLKMINSIFSTSFVFFILYYIIKIIDKVLEYKITFQYLTFFINLLAVYFMVIGCILFFYCINREQLEKNKKINKKSDNSEESQNFRVINIDVTPRDIDENVMEIIGNKKGIRDKHYKMINQDIP